MTQEQLSFLRLETKPAVSGIIEASFILGLHPDGVAYLVKVRHLVPLGDPPSGAQKYFSTRSLLALAEDERWLKKAVVMIRNHFRDKNLASKNGKPGQREQEADAMVCNEVATTTGRRLNGKPYV